MPGGLVALLDDVAAIAKVAATSRRRRRRRGGQGGRQGRRGGDRRHRGDTRLCRRPFARARAADHLEDHQGILRNKLLFLLPAAMALSALAPWAITPLLMLGGAYLCFEATEKIFEALTHTGHAEEVVEITDPEELEDRQVGGAIRTDFILSAEIMAIALAQLPEMDLLRQALVLAVVAVAITFGVYGAVALIVKMDDVGLHLSLRRDAGSARSASAAVADAAAAQLSVAGRHRGDAVGRRRHLQPRPRRVRRGRGAAHDRALGPRCR